MVSYIYHFGKAIKVLCKLMRNYPSDTEIRFLRQSLGCDSLHYL